MSIKYNDKTNNREVLLAGVSPVDQILNGTSKNAIANKAVFNALKEKIDKTVSDLVNYYSKSDVYNKAEVRALISTISTMDIQVVNALPTEDISTTTIYFLKPAGATTYDEYVYINNAWVKIGTTDLDLSQYVTNDALTLKLADYYTKAEITTLLTDYAQKADVYDKDAVDNLLDAKQDSLTFDSTPTAGSSNPVTSDGIKDAIDAKKFSNPNLLDNPWFTVNQRGQSNYPSTTWTYWVDRWQTLSKSSSTVGRTILLDNGIKISADTISTTCDIVYERKMKDDFVFGKTYTLSFMLGDGTIYSKSGVITEPDGTYKINITLTERGLNARIANETNQQVSCIITAVKDNTAMTLRAVKLELGEVSTLANDVIPDYATELAKCRTSTAVAQDVFANQGQINIGTPNPNLLDNPWFTVNQRGFNNASGGGTDSYRFDRWRGTYGYDTTNNIPAFTGVQYAIQRLEPNVKDFLNGKLLIASVMYSDGTIESGTFTYYKQPSDWITVSNITKVYVQIGYNATASNVLNGSFCITNKNTDLSIKAVKLELGTISTLINDVPPNYQQELAKCQRYFVRLGYPNGSTYEPIGAGFAKNTNQAYIYGSLPICLRQAPAITLSGKVYCQSPTKGLTSTPCTLHQSTDRGTMGYILYLTPDTENAFVQGEPLTAYFVQTSAGTNESYIDFSADL